MRLATRCPSCTTMFLVVEDQLRVSEGWVRCGRCANVFNAVEDLVDVGSGDPVKIDLASLQAGARLSDAGLADGAPEAAATSTRLTAPSRGIGHSASMPLDDLPDQLLRAPSEPDGAPAAALAPPPPPAQPPASPPTDAPSTLPISRPPADEHETLVPPRAVEPRTAEPLTAEPLVRDLFGPPADADADKDDATRPHTDLAEPVAASALAAPPETAANDNTAAGPESTLGTPSFVRRAAQADRWRRSPQRLGLGLLAGVLGLALLLQMGLMGRDTLAAQVPATAPLLQGLCGLLGCQVQPPRRIDQLAVDSSGLTKVDDLQAAARQRYRLSVLLRNRAETVVMAPALELTLSDVQGETLVRRVLRLRDFGVTAEALAPGQELPLRLQLDTGDRRVEGYTVELFYP